MSHIISDQNQPQVYQPKDTAPGPYPVPPPAVTHKDSSDQKVPPSGETKLFKGHGSFWRGCCAGLCCYCCLDMCF